jgi:putative ABC transport system ATP-binding protein
MIQIKNINKSFGELKVLENINIELQGGELLLVEGESGSGKSTLLNILATLMKPDSGEVIFENYTISKLTDTHASIYRKERLGYVTQDSYLIDDLTVWQNIFCALAMDKYSTKEIESMIQESMQKANIAHKKETIVSQLSGGEKQRCSIARAIVRNPTILLCDEPTSALDLANTQLFIDLVQEYLLDGKIVIIATHDKALATLPGKKLKIQEKVC